MDVPSVWAYDCLGSMQISDSMGLGQPPSPKHVLARYFTHEIEIK